MTADILWDSWYVKSELLKFQWSWMGPTKIKQRPWGYENHSKVVKNILLHNGGVKT